MLNLDVKKEENNNLIGDTTSGNRKTFENDEFMYHERIKNKSIFQEEERAELSKLHLRQESELSIERFNEVDNDKKQCSNLRLRVSVNGDKDGSMEIGQGFLRNQSVAITELEELGQSSNEQHLFKSYQKKENKLSNFGQRDDESFSNVICLNRIGSLKDDQYLKKQNEMSDDNGSIHLQTSNLKFQNKVNINASFNINQLSNNQNIDTNQALADRINESIAPFQTNQEKSKVKNKVNFVQSFFQQSQSGSQQTFNDKIMNSSHIQTQNDNKIKQKKTLNFVLQNQRKIKLIEKVFHKFLTFSQSFTVSGKSKLLSDKIRIYISDISDSPKLDNKISFNCILKSFFNFLLEKSRLNSLPLFDPENPIKIAINSIIVMYNCFFLYFTSIELFFEAHMSEFENVFGKLAQVAWVLEMLIQMNTCLYHDNMYITERQQIIRIYFKEYLFFEILPLIFEGRSSNNVGINVLLHLPLLLKIKGMTIILKKLEFYILQILSNHSLISLIKLLLSLFLVAHLYACVYNVVGEIDHQVLHIEHTWITTNELSSDEKWNTRYLSALYWAFTVIFNANITNPITQLEAGLTCFCMLASCVIYGYVLNVVGQLLFDIEKQQKDYKKDLNILNQFMKRRKVPLQISLFLILLTSFKQKSFNRKLRRKANISLQDHYANNKDRLQSEAEITKKIEPVVMKEILVSANFQLVNGISFFRDNFSTPILEKISVNLEEIAFAPRQVIIDQISHNNPNDSIFLVQKGKGKYFQMKVFKYFFSFLVTLFMKQNIKQILSGGDIFSEVIQNRQLFQNTEGFSFEDDQKSHMKQSTRKIIIKEIKTGESFGEYGLFTGNQEDNVYAESKGFSTVLRLKRSDLLAILEQEPCQFEKYCEIRDKLLNSKIISQDLKDFTCFLCSSKDHLLQDCDRVFAANKNQKSFLFRENYSIPMERQQQQRQKRRNKNSLNILGLLKDSVKQILQIEEYEEILSHYYQDPLHDEEDENSQLILDPINIYDLNKETTLLSCDNQNKYLIDLFPEIKEEQDFKRYKDIPEEPTSSGLKKHKFGAQISQIDEYIKTADSQRSIELSGRKTPLAQKRAIHKRTSIPQQIENFFNFRDIGEFSASTSERILGLINQLDDKQSQQMREFISPNKEKVAHNYPMISRKSPKQNSQALNRHETWDSQFKRSKDFGLKERERSKEFNKQDSGNFVLFNSPTLSIVNQNNNLDSNLILSQHYINNNQNLHPNIELHRIMQTGSKNRQISNQLHYQDDWVWQFDKFKNYTNYFPQANILKIIRKVNSALVKITKKKQSKRKESKTKAGQKSPTAGKYGQNSSLSSQQNFPTRKEQKKNLK